MTPKLRTTAVIARRDFQATVLSRTFLLFLIAPLFPILFGLLFGAVGGSMDKGGGPASIRSMAVSADPATSALVADAHDRLQTSTAVRPAVTLHTIELMLPDAKSIRTLLKEQPDVSAVLVIDQGGAILYGGEREVEGLRPYVSLLLAEAERDRALGPSRVNRLPPVRLSDVRFPTGDVQPERPNPLLGQLSQTLLFVLTLMLAGMLLSNFIEEKGNKVIEVLAAAAPMPAIFTGKLFAMLGSSLVGITVWGVAALSGYLMFSNGGVASLPVPAVGWPAFVVLGFLYFATNYLLVGALLLGIGAQAASVRQIQTISLPLTMAQLLLYGLASAAFSQQSDTIAYIAAIFPYSSPLTMIAHAAREPALWPHALALAWQALWVAITITVTAQWFKRGVLKSGRAKKRKSPERSSSDLRHHPIR